MTARRRAIAGVFAMLATLAAGPAVPAWAHPGHGTMALVGTLATVSADAVMLDVRDVASVSYTHLTLPTNREV